MCPFQRQVERELNTLVIPDRFALGCVSSPGYTPCPCVSVPAPLSSEPLLSSSSSPSSCPRRKPVVEIAVRCLPKRLRVAQSPAVSASASHDNETRPGYQLLQPPCWLAQRDCNRLSAHDASVRLPPHERRRRTSPQLSLDRRHSIRTLSIHQSPFDPLLLRRHRVSQYLGSLVGIFDLWASRFTSKMGGQGLTLLMLCLFLLGKYLDNRKPRAAHIIQRTSLLFIPLFSANLALLTGVTWLLPGLVFLSSPEPNCSISASLPSSPRSLPTPLLRPPHHHPHPISFSWPK